MFKFIKMHGAGNDFAIFDAREQKILFSKQDIIKIGNRNTGIGFDQLIVISPSHKADIKMEIYNTDGTSAQTCGNAARCVADLVGKLEGTIEMGSRLLKFKKSTEHTSQYTINMGKPELTWNKIPLSYTMDPLNLKFETPGFEYGASVSMGNPHLVFFSPSFSEEDIRSYGSYFEKHEFFPEHVNVNFATIINKNYIKLQVWERGTGLTLACGSGACATAVIAHTKKLIDQLCEVELPGGILTIEITTKGEVLMTGPAEKSFEGYISL